MKRKKKRENSSKSGVINIFERIYIKKKINVKCQRYFACPQHSFTILCVIEMMLVEFLPIFWYRCSLCSSACHDTKEYL